MEPDDVPEDEGPLLPWISPDDRLWRHPSEMGSSTPRPVVEETRPARSGSVRLWSVAVVAGVVGAVLASGVGVATGGLVQRTTTVLAPVTHMVTPSSMTVTTADTSSSVTAPNWPSIAASVAPSIVSITTSGPQGVQTGSGVLYTAAGDKAYILTASALVGDGSVRVTFDDSESQSAHLVGIDRETGLGLISVPGSKRIFPPFAQESSLQVAQPVLSVGALNAVGGPDVAPGSVSALDVAVNSGDDATMENLIDINSTDSVADLGAALVEGDGAVFGIEASVDSPDGTQANETYAVPFDVADHVANQMLAGVTVTHPWLGTVDSKDPSTATAAQLSLRGGSQITQVSPDSPAQRAGMQASDIITAFDGHPVSSTGALTALVSACNPGALATVSFIHRGQPREATVTLADAPSDVDLGVAAGG